MRTQGISTLPVQKSYVTYNHVSVGFQSKQHSNSQSQHAHRRMDYEGGKTYILVYNHAVRKDLSQVFWPKWFFPEHVCTSTLGDNQLCHEQGRARRVAWIDPLTQSRQELLWFFSALSPTVRGQRWHLRFASVDIAINELIGLGTGDRASRLRWPILLAALRQNLRRLVCMSIRFG